MNLEQVAHYIAHPHELGLSEAPALKSMSEKHPYASVFSLLYLTALANGKSVDLDDALQQHAYRLSDRTRLYHLLHGQSELVAAEEDAKAEISSEETVSEDTSTAAISAEPVETTPSVMGTPPDFPLSAEQASSKEETESPPVSEDFDRITEAFTREQHFEVSSQQEETPVSLHEEGMREVTEPDPTEEAEETALPEESTAAIRLTSPSEEEVTASPEEASKEMAEAESAPGETKRSFTSWLKSGDHAAESAPEKEASEGAALTDSPSKQENAEPAKRSFDDIIDNFIKEEPTITRGKTEFYSPSRKAKESLDEEAVPVSETLAKIFAAQGNYPKAIHVYHQLMLSFPEKKSFFAVQIEALKKKITP